MEKTYCIVCPKLMLSQLIAKSLNYATMLLCSLQFMW